jgi:hypothetical protein
MIFMLLQGAKLFIVCLPNFVKYCKYLNKDHMQVCPKLFDRLLAPSLMSTKLVPTCLFFLLPMAYDGDRLFRVHNEKNSLTLDFCP